MRFIVYKCDRCKKDCKPTWKSREDRNLKLIDFENEEYDLCPTCQNELESWWDIGAEDTEGKGE